MSEKHTHQGHWTANPGAQKDRPGKGGAKQDLRTIAGPGCWCGEPNGHDWPGRAEGEPHPRST